MERAPTSCVQSLAGNGSVSGSRTTACLTANPPNDRDYYTRFYTFTLSSAAAPYSYLLDGAGTGGAIKCQTGASNASAATITTTLQPGSYTHRGNHLPLRNRRRLHPRTGYSALTAQPSNKPTLPSPTQKFLPTFFQKSRIPAPLRAPCY